MSETAPEMPPDPWVNQDMLPLARNSYEMFGAFVAAGFTENQAIQIVVGLVSAMLIDAHKA